MNKIGFNDLIQNSQIKDAHENLFGSSKGEKSVRERKLEHVIESERVLSEIKDSDILLESILSEARSIVNADSGSIYIVDDENPNKLKIKYAQNNTQQSMLAPGEKLPYNFFSFEINEKSIAGYCALKHEIVNIEDAYNIPEDKPYKFNVDTDRKTGYKTTSMMTLPLVTSNGDTLGVLQIINAQDENGNVITFDEDAEMYIKHFAKTATQAMEKADLLQSMVMRLVGLACFRDPKETGAHVNRVAAYSVEIYDRWAFKNNISEKERNKFRDTLSLAAKLHDVGKVAVPDTILKLPRRFEPHERNIMNKHTYVVPLLFPSLKSDLDIMTRDIALRHQEKWDGTGYPGHYNPKDVTDSEKVLDLTDVKGLKGTEIPLSARIVSVADVFDALCSKRCYKSEWNIEDAKAEIIRCSGTQFDPEVVEAFIDVFDAIVKIQAAIKDKDKED